ncbi:hypothetical protein B7463_g11090, partial [Scytalidium lignicola]
MSADDPWNWDVDRVVKELCTLDRSWQPLSAVMKLSDPESLERALREQEVYGTVLLTSVDERSLREDLGLKILGRRVFVKNAIEELRLKSAEYQKRIGKQPAFPSSQSNLQIDEPVLQLPDQYGWHTSRSFTRSLPYRLDLTASIHDKSSVQQASIQPAGSVIFHTGEVLSTYEDGSRSRLHEDKISYTGNNIAIHDDTLDVNEVTSKRRRIDEPAVLDDFDSGIETYDDKSHQPSVQVEGDNHITALLPSDGPSMTSQGINAKKRKRIAPTLISTSIDPSRSREIPTAADTVILHDPNNVEPGIPFIGDDGRKRVVPIGQSSSPFLETPSSYEQENNQIQLPQKASPNLVTGTVLPAKDVEIGKSTRSSSEYSLEAGYLGKRKMPVDDIFYAGVTVGQKIPSFHLVEDFSQGMQRISSGRRLYVNNRIRHFLRSERKEVQRNGKFYSAIVPYQATLIPLQEKPSFTLFSTNEGSKAVVTREALSSWPEIDPDILFNKSVNISSSGEQFMLGGSSYDDWDPSSLEKYRLLPGGDEVLPIYGESDEDNEYDYNTWKEINDERNSPLKPRRIQLKKPPITTEEVNQAIDQTIQEIVRKWKNVRLPKQERKAWSIWTKSRRNGDKDKKLHDIREILGRYEKRIPLMRNEILKEKWTSQDQVKKQTQIMEPTLFDIQEARWWISVLRRKSAPQRPLRKCRVDSKGVAAVSGTKEDDEPVYSDLELASSEDDMDDFVVSDNEGSIATDGELELDQADGEETETESALSDISSAEVLSSTPRHPFTETVQIPTERSPFSDRNMAMDLDENIEQIVLPPANNEIAKDSAPIKDEQLLTQDPTSSAGVPEVVDLTMMSSDDGPQVVNLVTPVKKPKIKLFVRDSTIRISDSDEAAIVMPKARFPEFYQFLDDSAHLFDYSADMPMSSASQTVFLKEERNNVLGANNSSSQDLDHELTESLESSEGDLPRNATPRRKFRRKIFEDAKARDLREQDRQRLLEQEERRRILLAKLSKDVANVNRNRIIINDGKFEHQGCVYVNEHIAGRIKKHQVEGVQFMWNQIIANDRTTQGCLLAHSMGLGKTMQVVTLLVAIAEAASSTDESVSSQIPESLRQSKTLILCPPSLINNWIDELLIWAPKAFWESIGRLMLQFIHETDFGLLETKHGVPLNEDSHTKVSKHLLKGPNIIVADEAHKMKNAKSAITTVASGFRSTSRIALTGSPLANNVEEYHTMIDWVAPNYLGPIEEFRNKYVYPIQEGLWHDSTAMERRRALKLLGVLKEDVAPKVHRAGMSVLRGDLPPKKEFILTVPLTALQENAYILYVRSIVESQDSIVSQTTLWHWLAILSLLCNHPACFKAKLTERKDDALRDANSRPPSVHPVREDMDKEEIALDFNEPIWKVGVSEELIKHEMRLFDQVRSNVESIAYSNKVKILCQILDASKAVGDKVLVFSQSIPTLNYLEKLCIKSGRKYARLDGNTPIHKRQSATKAFNAGNTELYLISTTAGGLGLNIPGANRVIIFDFKFNPIMEEQAVGRAYRIGQTKKVFVYRLVAGGTFEDGIHNKAVFKTQLASRVVDKKNPIAWAKKDTAAYLHVPKDVEQKDLSEFKGMDPAVLDVILAYQSKDPTIRAIVQTDTFEQDDNDRLTIEEQKEVDQLISDAKLQRSNPEEWLRLIQQRNQIDYARWQTSAVGQASHVWQAPTRISNWVPLGQNLNVHHRPDITNKNAGNPTPDRPPLSPTLAGNTRVVPEAPFVNASNTSSVTPGIVTPLQSGHALLPTLGANKSVLPEPTATSRKETKGNAVQTQSTAQTSATSVSPGRPLSPIRGQNTKSLPDTFETESASYESPYPRLLGSWPRHAEIKGASPKTGKESRDSTLPTKSPSNSPKKTVSDNRGHIQNVGISKYPSLNSVFKNQSSARSVRRSNGETGLSYQPKKLVGKLPNRRDFRIWSEQNLAAYLRTYNHSERGNMEELIARCEAKDHELLEELAASQQELKKAPLSPRSNGNAKASQQSVSRHRYNPTFGTPMFAAMNRKPVQSLRTPVAKSRPTSVNTHNQTGGKHIKSVDQRHQSHTRHTSQNRLPERSTASDVLPGWAYDQLRKNSSAHPKARSRAPPSPTT